MYEKEREALENLKLTPPPDPRRKTLRHLVGSLSKDIEQVLKMGYSLKDVAEALGNAGVTIAPATLREYLRNRRKSAGKRKPAGGGANGFPLHCSEEI